LNLELYNLGKIPWQETQLIYHALAYLGRESLVLVSPASPYVCIGYHQDATQEVDLEFCKANHVPVFRREVGGGAVYLDGNQLFFHLILRDDNPAIPLSKKAFYKKFLQPVIEVHHRIGIPAEFKPVNDVIVGNKKISGTGVGEIGDCVVFVGNLILDFNYEMMSKVLKVPDEKFRGKVRKTIEENLTTIRRELGPKESEQWDEKRLNASMAEAFEEILGPFVPCQKDAALEAKMQELGSRMLTDQWLLRKRKTKSERSVKIRAGVTVMHQVHKAPGGLIRADYNLSEGKLSSVSISGDFFCYPEDGIDRLESILEGTNEADAQQVLTDFCKREDIEIPGVGLADWMAVFGK
jgi:lipoate---protein ligase